MKNIFLIRHAKSDWKSYQSDRERQLTSEGKSVASKIANYLYEKQFKIDRFISSPAIRAVETASIFAARYNEKHISLFEELYEPDVKDFLFVIRNVDDKFDSVAVFSHNPGITVAASEFTGIKIDYMPECSVFALHTDVSTWKGFSGERNRYSFFVNPSVVVG